MRWLAFLSPFLLSFSLQAQPLSFSDALAAMRAGDESLAAAQALEQQRMFERRAAAGLQLPNVEGNARFNRINEPIVIDLEQARQLLLALNPQVPPGAIPALNIGVQGEVFWRANMRVTQPIYTGGRISAAKQAADARIRDSGESRRDVEQTLITDLVRRYYGLQLAEQVHGLRAQALSALRQHSYVARRLFEEGQIARPERLNAEVAEAEAERLLRAAEYDVELARTALRLLLPAAGDDISAASPLFLVNDIGPLDAYRSAGESANPSLRRLDAQKDLARQGVRVARSDFLPSVAAFGVRELWEPDLTLLDPTWVVGVNIQWNFFDGGRKQNQLRAAREQQRRVELLQSKATRAVSTLVQRSYQNTRKAKDLYTTLDKTLALADENVRVRKRAFEEGFATSLEVVNAELSRQAVELQRLAAAYDYVVALAELLEASGQSDRFEEWRSRADVVAARGGSE
ncbi:MAG: TolC family protein [Bryobacterales bacterium]|nr:TolC family protein [Bryobacterales bacterium]